ncbi:MBL fold metallo-hydrolase [Cocleimonas sp. KMM 6892]|uniref:MBL fold metallo-hydrolase n=1 Tax=unclassified Cocleimonas TaxID=2639732 RepID=UPI002DC01B33|nr:MULTISPECIES: MBL fold metallo-hydrolase [unclassified Cocleimonas]MEB8431694.1 MBL fold metallo-hydrolase [Cocleimonas sp. KMM 6892]MEC4715220.1 MBL fold metallo-hydrolase [Cocleimonas sp. KMM 6895]MEC4743966.1 MBL fold metallo-hydrolase [Cocleimonas sp. KMM 6896]
MKQLKNLLPANVKNTLSVCFATVILTISGVATAENTFDTQAVKDKYSVRDYVYAPMPERGYNYYEIAKDTYFVHDEFEHMVFFVTDDGVVVYDPKPDVSPFVLKVIPQVTDKPITHVIYSHHHRDHSQGAYLFPESAELIANERTTKFLAIAKDPKRPMPDTTWSDSYVLETGGLRLEFKDLGRNWHSQDDTIMYAPQQKILFATDMFHADAAPWIHFGESSDPMFAFMLPGILLDTYDFEFVIPGHERIVPTRAHMETYKALIADMQKILFEVVKSPAFQKSAEEAAKRYKDGQDHWEYKESIMTASNLCASKFIENWAGRVRNANLNAVENCQTMFMHQIILDP